MAVSSQRAPDTLAQYCIAAVSIFELPQKATKLLVIIPDVLIEINYVVCIPKQQLTKADKQELKPTQKSKKRGYMLNIVWNYSY